MAFTYQALILAGGRSSRLGGTPKALLSNGHSTLLASALASCAGATHRVVVGPADLPLPLGVLNTREDPPFSGPAAGISAGLTALGTLGEAQVSWTLLLSCDVPAAAGAVQLLTRAAAHAPATVTGYWGLAGEVYQPLLGIYRTPQLAHAFSGDTSNASVRRFLRPLEPQPLPLPVEFTQDVDTWEQAVASGYTQPTVG